MTCLNLRFSFCNDCRVPLFRDENGPKQKRAEEPQPFNERYLQQYEGHLQNCLGLGICEGIVVEKQTIAKVLPVREVQLIPYPCISLLKITIKHELHPTWLTHLILLKSGTRSPYICEFFVFFRIHEFTTVLTMLLSKISCNHESGFLRVNKVAVNFRINPNGD